MSTGISDDSVKDHYRLLTVSKTKKNVKQELHYDAVLLYLEGYPQKRISEILQIPRRTVSNHIFLYYKLLEGLPKENRNRLELIFPPPCSPSLNNIKEL